MSDTKKSINFIQNWNNKLDADFFTTVRADIPNYYTAGEFYLVFLNKHFKFEVQILEIKRFELKDVNKFISYLDAGINPDQFRQLIKNMYPTKDFAKEKLLLLLLKKIK